MGAVGFRCCNALSLGDVVILLGAGAASAVLQVHDGRVAVELQDDERPAQSGCAPAAMGASWTVTLAGCGVLQVGEPRGASVQVYRPPGAPCARPDFLDYDLTFGDD